MAVNTRVREEQDDETLAASVERHRRLLATVETGDRSAVLAELEDHGNRAVLEAAMKDRTPGQPLGVAG